MLGSCPRGGGEQPQGVLAAGGQLTDGRGGCFSFYHVPQQCRREKLRYANAAEAAPPLFMRPSPSSHMLNPHYNTSPYDHGFPPLDLFNPNPLLGGDGSEQHQGQGFSLSLSSAVVDDQQHHHGQAQGASPMAGPPSVVSAVQRVGPVPAGPFTGYATILNSSRFLRPAQQLLEETCGGGVGGSLVGSGDEVEALDIAGDIPERTDTLDGVIGGGEQRRMKSRLILMLDEVYRRYKQYYHQIQAVISSFEAVSGLSMAAPYAPLALRSLSKHFKSLKNVVAEQLRFASKCVGKEGQSGEDIPSYRLASNAGLCFPRVAHCSGAVSQQPAWRPQRGLPERAVSVLRSWLFEHFLHPYPTDMDKQMLAKQTGLSRNQVSNWFINARVRLWKPMVEEIHSLEQQHDHRKAPQSDSSRGANKQPELLTSPSAVSAGDKQAPPAVSSSFKRSRAEFSQLPNHIKDPLNFSLEDFSAAQHRAGVPVTMAGGVHGGVSLTLGLHQNGGTICFSNPPMPMSGVHRFGIEDGGGVGFAMDSGGFEGHEQHHNFGKEFDGQLHHIF